MVWVIVILLATNLSMGISFLYPWQQEKKSGAQTEEQALEVPAQQRTRFFREQLNLESQQVELFREINREYNRTAWQFQHRLSGLRAEMVLELGKVEPDHQKLDALTSEIGELHKLLKNETIDYYLAMKNECTEAQQEKLHEIFISILDKNENVKLPQGGRRYRNNQQGVQ